MSFSPEILLLFFFIALVAATIDAIAGGGGLITLPALLATGMLPAVAVATNKVGAVGGSFSAALHFIRKGHVRLRDLIPHILCVFVGAVLGAVVVSFLSARILMLMIPFMLIGFAVFFLFSPNLGVREEQARLSAPMFIGFICPLLGFYDGFCGPGTGTLMVVACVMLQGFSMLKATATTKVLNATSNIAALLFFIAHGQIFWEIGLVMLAGQLVGGNLGARIAISKGQRLIRILMVVVSIAMSIKLLLGDTLAAMVVQWFH